ncbi:MAG: ankyrin repeat domain-containing protein, partial [Proteobacteria bacterium]|nr:ankyrin repeat domain-containing protein [Pseudomonadota bacterium]
MAANDDLVAACDNKDVKGAQAALAAGASPDARDGRGMTVLETAFALKSKALAKLLVEAGADVNTVDQDGRSPLHLLADKLPDPALAALLLDKGARIDQLDAVAYAGYAALHVAVQRAKLDLAGCLLDRGADLEVRNTEHGNTPLLLLTKSRSGVMSRTEVTNARWLIDRGADVNATNAQGATPLH